MNANRREVNYGKNVVIITVRNNQAFLVQELSAYLISSPCSERGNCALDIYFKECLVWHMRQSSALEGNIVFVLWYLQVKQTSFIINVCHGSMVQWSSLYCQSFACWDTFPCCAFCFFWSLWNGAHFVLLELKLGHAQVPEDPLVLSDCRAGPQPEHKWSFLLYFSPLPTYTALS